MTSLHMLDTNMVSYIVKGRSRVARARLLALQGDDIACVSSITEAEIRYGLARRPEATALKTLMDGFLASVQVLAWGRDEAKAYGRLRAGFEKSGTVLGNMDMLIAAHAVAIGAVLVTNDKTFSRVDGLRATQNWATDL
jgi:tRNA(fMet)-specific endonuclease VapC